MPIPLGPAIMAGGQLLSQGINAITGGAMNRKTREWNEKMYGRQRQDSLADWAMVNQYNHPSQQMSRLREAGLNPNLVYGNGATTEGSPMRSTDVKSWNPSAPTFDLGAASGAFFNTQISQAQIDNLKEDNRLKQAQTLATLHTADKTLADKNSVEFDLAMRTILQDITVASAQTDLLSKNWDIVLKQKGADKIEQEIESQKTSTAISLRQDERAAAMQSSNLREALERILSMREARAKSAQEREHIQAQIKLLDHEEIIKILDKKMKRKEADDYINKDIRRSDSFFNRSLLQILDYFSKLPDKPKEEIISGGRIK